MQKDFNIQYNIWKKTFKTIQQLTYFVGHPVPCVNLYDREAFLMWTPCVSEQRNQRLCSLFRK